MLPEDEVDAAVARLRADLDSGAWERRHADVLERDELDLGFRVVVAEYAADDRADLRPRRDARRHRLRPRLRVAARAGRARHGDRRLADPPADRDERRAVHPRGRRASSAARSARTEAHALQDRHGELFREMLPERRPLPGAPALLARCAPRGVVHGIATSGRRPEIDASLDVLGVPADDGRRPARRRRPREARARPLPRVRPARSASTRRTASSSATRSGTCSPPAARGCSASGCCRAATATTSSPGPARSASTATPPSCTPRSTSSASRPRSAFAACRRRRGRSPSGAPGRSAS